MNKEQYKVWIDVSKQALRNNLRILKRLKSPKTKLWAVVKSNAYGHGLFLISPFLEKAGADGFCVDSVLEGRRLRQEGVKKPILVMGPTLARWLSMAAQNHITITISSWEFLREYAKATERFNERPAFHLKIDTGMHRQGFFPDQVPEVLAFIKKNDLPLSGVYTHFADSSTDRAYTDAQFKKFLHVKETAAAAGFKVLFHCANTGAFLSGRKYDLDMVRLGNAVYGLAPAPIMKPQFRKHGLAPALSWRALISEIKQIPADETVGYSRAAKTGRSTTLALIPIGFWHGYPWSLWNKAEVLVGGKRAKIFGRISMDMMAVDITEIPAKVGDTATLIGKDGTEEISAYEMADLFEVRPQEIVTRLNPLTMRFLR